MNRIDVLLNAIAQKHLEVEVVDFPSADPTHRLGSLTSKSRLHGALLAAFEGGVRHAAALGGRAPNFLLREVDVDVGMPTSSALKTYDA